MPKQEIVGIMDRSGSMMGKEADTVGGINTMLKELKEKQETEDQINVSIKLFDHEEILVWRHKPLDEITEFPLKEFQPRGQTALLDALGNTLTYFMEKKLMDPQAYDNCFIYIATDGYENSSKHYTKATLKKLIENAKTIYNIDIVYLGANQDAILEAQAIGISPEQAINYNENSENTQAVYRSAARVASEGRNNRSLSFTPGERQASQTPC